jgi:hypothetical protein
MSNEINLHDLACKLARTDNSAGSDAGYNESVIGAETALAQLGKHLRASTSTEAAAIVAAIVERAGA